MCDEGNVRPGRRGRIVCRSFLVILVLWAPGCSGVTGDTRRPPLQTCALPPDPLLRGHSHYPFRLETRRSHPSTEAQEPREPVLLAPGMADRGRGEAHRARRGNAFWKKSRCTRCSLASSGPARRRTRCSSSSTKSWTLKFEPLRGRRPPWEPQEILHVAPRPRHLLRPHRRLQPRVIHTKLMREL